MGHAISVAHKQSSWPRVAAYCALVPYLQVKTTVRCMSSAQTMDDMNVAARTSDKNCCVFITVNAPTGSLEKGCLCRMKEVQHSTAQRSAVQQLGFA